MFEFQYFNCKVIYSNIVHFVGVALCNYQLRSQGFRSRKLITSTGTVTQCS
jgi:hypothetical protein